MGYKAVGFFQELDYLESDQTSLRDSIRESPEYDKESVVKYLLSGIIKTQYYEYSTDVLDQDQVIGPVKFLTDGVWIWPLDLAYYVERYNVVLPPEFIAHMEANHYNPTKLEDVTE